eukprot:maker-scaffold206_size259025-snap-gene-0.11 protein:Tk10929 transcript:maker-scaffold206_size259025-snap-gene-0.11-mRNA-1 annotation:"---NA---"
MSCMFDEVDPHLFSVKMVSNYKNLMAFSAIVLTICVTISYGGSINKRDIGDDINDQIPQGSICVTDDGCSVFEFCNHEGLSFHCKLRGWVIAVIVIVIARVVGSITALAKFRQLVVFTHSYCWLPIPGLKASGVVLLLDLFVNPLLEVAMVSLGGLAFSLLAIVDSQKEGIVHDVEFGQELHVGREGFHELLLGFLANVDLKAIVDEVIVLESRVVLLALLLRGLPVNCGALQVILLMDPQVNYARVTLAAALVHKTYARPPSPTLSPPNSVGVSTAPGG